MQNREGEKKRPIVLEPNRRERRAPQFRDIKEKQWHLFRLYCWKKVLRFLKKSDVDLQNDFSRAVAAR
ncbi:hypothetical protein [Dickeya chrysanthemi]|uniref:hypothetical protein n=1 Tax=Dickeya chrysanthemi TaxID=556 RepID=UPI000532D6BF|nr:hypothetical protein [Dickeya chrysanthemi]